MRALDAEPIVTSVGVDTRSTVWRLYCASKPLAAHTALTAARLSGSNLDDDLGVFLNSDGLSGLTLSKVLTHSGGLKSTPAARFHPSRDYRIVREMSADDIRDPHLDGKFFYSHTLGWSVLACAIEALASTDSFADAVRDLTIDRYHLPNTSYYLNPTLVESYSALDRAGSARKLRDKSDPMYRAPNPSWGAASTIIDMLNFYVGVRRDQLDGDEVSLLMISPKALGAAPGHVARPVGHGLLVDMQRELGNRTCSPSNFGHGASATFGRNDYLVNEFWYDIEAEAAFAIVIDGAIQHGDARISEITRCLYQDARRSR